MECGFALGLRVNDHVLCTDIHVSTPTARSMHEC